MKYRTVLNVYNPDLIKALNRIGKKRSEYASKAIENFFLSKRGREILEEMTGELTSARTGDRNEGLSENAGRDQKSSRPAPPAAASRALRTEDGRIDIDEIFKFP